MDSQGFKPRARVPLPEGAEYVEEVYLNSIVQVEGVDYRRAGGALLFAAPIRREGKLGWVRWAGLFFGFFGTYRQNDGVDVLYQKSGKRILASMLEIEPIE